MGAGPDEGAGSFWLPGEGGDHRNYQWTPARDWAAPTPTTLTYVDWWWGDETAWALQDLQRTSTTSQNPQDQFVRILHPFRYFGFQIVLIAPSACAVGAISDVLGRPALLYDGAVDPGIFAVDKRSAIEGVLVKNGVSMSLFVDANKERSDVEGMLAATACTPGDLTACEDLRKALEASSRAISADAAASDVATLQADMDPRWSPAWFGTSQVSILP
jgi:hypothetical protein